MNSEEETKGENSVFRIPQSLLQTTVEPYKKVKQDGRVSPESDCGLAYADVSSKQLLPASYRLHRKEEEAANSMRSSDSNETLLLYHPVAKRDTNESLGFKSDFHEHL